MILSTEVGEHGETFTPPPAMSTKDFSMLDYFGGPMEFLPKILPVEKPNETGGTPWIRTPEFLIEHDIRNEPVLDSNSYALWSVGYHVSGTLFQYEAFLDCVGDCIGEEVADRTLAFYAEYGRPALSIAEIRKGHEGEAVNEATERERKDAEAIDASARAEALREQVLALRAAGYSVRGIAAETGVKRWKVERILKEARTGKGPSPGPSGSEADRGPPAPDRSG
jgi:hypothetical protein